MFDTPYPTNRFNSVISRFPECSNSILLSSLPRISEEYERVPSLPMRIWSFLRPIPSIALPTGSVKFPQRGHCPQAGEALEIIKTKSKKTSLLNIMRFLSQIYLYRPGNILPLDS